MKIDKIDVRILTTLLKDARTSFSSIAKDCGVTTSTIVQHFNKLKKSGIIAGTTLRLNMKDFKNRYAIVIDMDVEQEDADNIIEYLSGFKNLISCYNLLGRHDIHASLLVQSIKEIDRIRDKIQVQKGVKRIFISTSTDEIGCFPNNLIIKPTADE